MLVEGVWETIYIVFLSSALPYVIDIPLGIALVVMDKEGISLVPLSNKVLGPITNLLRSVSSIILLIVVLPIIKFIVGKAVGSNAAAVSLIITASSYIGRMVESSLREVDAGVIEVTRPMDAFTWQTIVKMLLPEAKPSLLVGAAISVAIILGCPVMAGSTGEGGLGDVATRYGHYRYQTDMMMATVVFLVIIVQLIQEVAMHISKENDERIR